MKKLIIFFAVLTISAGVFGQGFFKPVPKNLFSGEKAIKAATGTWLFRPAVTLTAMQFSLTKPVEVASLTSLGTGVSYAHFIDNEGVPYNNFSVNALLLFNQDLINGSVEPAKLSLAITGSFLQFVSVGAGINFSTKKFFLLTGVVYNFN